MEEERVVMIAETQSKKLSWYELMGVAKIRNLRPHTQRHNKVPSK